MQVRLCWDDINGEYHEKHINMITKDTWHDFVEGIKEYAAEKGYVEIYGDDTKPEINGIYRGIPFKIFDNERGDNDESHN